jgi:hypothetical protein
MHCQVNTQQNKDGSDKAMHFMPITKDIINFTTGSQMQVSKVHCKDNNVQTPYHR